MTYRPARTPEILESHGELGELKRWREHVWLARALFGSHAARMVVTAEWRDVVPLPGQALYVTLES